MDAAQTTNSHECQAITGTKPVWYLQEELLDHQKGKVRDNKTREGWLGWRIDARCDMQGVRKVFARCTPIVFLYTIACAS